jgi:hypothetical protein
LEQQFALELICSEAVGGRAIGAANKAGRPAAAAPRREREQVRIL